MYMGMLTTLPFFQERNVIYGHDVAMATATPSLFQKQGGVFTGMITAFSPSRKRKRVDGHVANTFGKHVANPTIHFQKQPSSLGVPG